MESNKFSEIPLVGASDSGSTNLASPPASEDTGLSGTSQHAQSTGSVDSPALLNSSVQRGRRHSRSRRAVASSPTPTTARQLNQSRAIAPKLPTTNLSLLIFTAVATCQKKSGLSMQALKKIVTNMGYDMEKKKPYFLRSIKSMVAKGQLCQVKGNGARGSFKINPDLVKKKQQPKMKGKGQKAKESTKKKDSSAKSKNGKNNAKKEGKVDSSKRVSKKSRIPPQAVQSQVKV